MASKIMANRLTTPPNVGQTTNSHPTVTRHNADSVPEQSTRYHPTVSCVGYICQHCEGTHLSQTATDLVLSSWRDKFTKSYNSFFGKWASWSSEWNRNPFSGLFIIVFDIVFEQLAVVNRCFKVSCLQFIF